MEVPAFDGKCWYDNLHLSDYGLKRYMAAFEKQISELIRGQSFNYQADDFPILRNDIYKRRGRPRRKDKKKNGILFSFTYNCVVEQTSYLRNMTSIQKNVTW